MDNIDFVSMTAGAAAEVGAGASRYTHFGVSITHKGQLAMRGTTADKYASRMRTFARDGDTKIVIFDLARAMHKSVAAGLLLKSELFRKECVSKGHDWAAVEQFLARQSGTAAAVQVLKLTDVAELAEEAQQLAEPPAEIVLPVDSTVPHTELQQQETAATDAAELLEQQEAEDAGETAEEASVEASPKARKRR